MLITVTLTSGARNRVGARTFDLHLTGGGGSHRIRGRSEPQLDRGAARAVFPIEAPDVGRVQLVELTIAGADCFVDDVIVEGPEGIVRFPCYAWVTPARSVTLLPARACLAAQEPSARVREARRAEIERRRATYRWADGEGLPDHLGEQDPSALPLDERFTPSRDDRHHLDDLQVKANAMAVTAATMFDPWDALDDEDKLYVLLPRPTSQELWREDEEFGRQCLAGVAPTHIRRARSLPPGFEAGRAAIETRLGGSVEEALATERVYLLDYTVLHGIPLYSEPEGERRYCPPSLCLLHLGADDRLRPVAIVLDPTAGTRVYTPADADAWTLAKTYVKCAEANLHQVVTHALLTHLSMEPYLIATMRNLSSPHPLFKLLRRHAYGLVQINAEARQVLLGRGGVFDEFVATGGPARGHVKLAARVYEGWTLAHNELPRDLEARGVAALPGYAYAEDALDLWNAIERYVAATLRPFYPDVATVRADEELADWLADARAHGRLEEGRGADPEDLVRIVTTIIFTVSVQHAAVNFLQYDHFGYLPNAPAAMRAPMPSHPPTAADWIRALPTRPQSLRQLSVAYLLSRHAPDEQYLLPAEGWRERWFDEPDAVAAIEDFHTELRLVAERIRERNLRRPLPYEWLLPTRVPVSTAV